MHVLAVGSPKGGVGKTTTAVTLAAIAARLLQLRTLLVDCDSNRSALDWCAQAGDAIPVDTADGHDLTSLRRLRAAADYDLAVVDLPGAREGAFETILTGDSDRPVADVLVIPTEPEVMAIRPVIRVIRGEITPLRLPHLVVLCRVDPQALARAASYRMQLRDGYGLVVAETVIRSYSIYREALERSRTVLDVGGLRSYARRAEADYRHLTAEVLTMLGTNTAPLKRGRKSWHALARLVK